MIPSSAPRKRTRDTAFGGDGGGRPAASAVGESSPAVPATVSKPPPASLWERSRGAGARGGQKQTQPQTRQNLIVATPARPAASRRADFFGAASAATVTTTPRIAEVDEEDDYSNDDYDDDDDGAVLPSSPVALRRIAQPRFTTATRPARRAAVPIPVPVPVPHVDSGIGMLSSSPPRRGGGAGTGTRKDDVLAETPRKPARPVPAPGLGLGTVPEKSIVVATTPVVVGGKTKGYGAAFAGADTRKKGVVVGGDKGGGGGGGVAGGKDEDGDETDDENENESPKRRPTMSIYERLGWDDDFDELG